MITGKKNIKRFGLDKFPYNFKTYTSYSLNKVEYGWTGVVLLNVLKHIKEYIYDLKEIPSEEHKQTILIADSLSFDKSVDVINKVFYPLFIKKEYDRYQPGGINFTDKNGNKYSIWFPHMSTNGKAASSSNWINIFSQEENVILEKGGDSNEMPEDIPRIVFSKTKNNPYIFKGVYLPDFDTTSIEERYYKRISKKIDLSNGEISILDNNQDILVEKIVFHKILFCNITYMKEYKGITIDDIPKNGGSYVRLKQDAGEKYNFYPLNDGTIKGFVETKHKEGFEEGDSNQLHIERIDERCKSKDSIDNVLVVFLCYKRKSWKSDCWMV